MFYPKRMGIMVVSVFHEDGRMKEDNNKNVGSTQGTTANNNNKNGKNRNFKKKDGKKKKAKTAYVPPYSIEIMSKSVSEIGLSELTVQVLLNSGIDTLGKICSRTSGEMYYIQRFGKKQLIEVSAVLKKLNVDFRVAEEEKANKNGETEVKHSEKTVKDDNRQNKKERTEQRAKDKAVKDNGAEKKPNAQKQVQANQKVAKKNEPFDQRKIFPKAPFVPSPKQAEQTDRFVKFQRGGKWGFKDKNGKEVIPPIYDEVFNFKEDLACVERKELFGYITRDNELVIPYKYEVASSFSEGLACVGNESKCGYINKEGEIVIPFIYDAGTPFVNGVAQVKQNERWGTYSLETKEVDWNN